METTDSAGDESTGTTVRSDLPPAIGVDAEGLVHHCASKFARRVYLVDGTGEVVDDYHMDSRSRAEWVAFVRERRGWRDCWHDERVPPAELPTRIGKTRTGP